MNKQLIAQLEEAKTAWNALTVIPDDLAAWGFAGLTKVGIANALSTIETLAVEIEAQGEEEFGSIADLVLAMSRS